MGLFSKARFHSSQYVIFFFHINTGQMVIGEIGMECFDHCGKNAISKCKHCDVPLSGGCEQFNLCVICSRLEGDFVYSWPKCCNILDASLIDALLHFYNKLNNWLQGADYCILRIKHPRERGSDRLLFYRVERLPNGFLDDFIGERNISRYQAFVNQCQSFGICQIVFRFEGPQLFVKVYQATVSRPILEHIPFVQFCDGLNKFKFNSKLLHRLRLFSKLGPKREIELEHFSRKDKKMKTTKQSKNYQY